MEAQSIQANLEGAHVQITMGQAGGSVVVVVVRVVIVGNRVQ
jgi:hypothetical protein